MAKTTTAKAVVNTTAKEVVQPEVQQTQITAQDLQYLYQVLDISSVPARDAEFVVQLRNKLQTTLGIK